MSNDRNHVTITFCGKSSTEVTQSCYKVSTPESSIILDYGLYQNNNLIINYKVNNARYKEIKPKDIDYIFISHANIDHCGALPSLYKKGCTAPIYIPKGNKELMKLMFKDSAKIMASDAEKLVTKYSMKAAPMYEEDDIDVCLNHFIECDFEEEITVKETKSETIKVTFKSAHHIINSAQILLNIRTGNSSKKILYTGDIGSPYIDKPYVLPFSHMDKFVDCVIGEATYAGDKRNHSNKDRLKDIEKIKMIIEETCVENKAKVLFPVFSLDRLQVVLTTLYKIYGTDQSFNIPVIIDTPLGLNVCDLWGDMITQDKELWNSVISWKNIMSTREWSESLTMQTIDKPMIVLASSGMCTNGRCVSWVKRMIENPQNHICFCGFSAEGTLARDIKESKKCPTIKIEGKSYKNKCNITSLFSFSSHASRQELLELYSMMNYNKLFLVHSDGDHKYEFAEELKEILSKQNKTCRVIIPHKDYKANI